MACSEIITTTNLIALLLISHAKGAANHKTVNLHIEGRVKNGHFCAQNLNKKQITGHNLMNLNIPLPLFVFFLSLNILAALMSFCDVDMWLASETGAVRSLISTSWWFHAVSHSDSLCEFCLYMFWLTITVDLLVWTSVQFSWCWCPQL